MADDPKPDPTPDPTADPKPDPKADPKPDPTPDPKPDPKPDEPFDPDRAMATIKAQRASEAAAKARADAAEAKVKEFERRDMTDAQKLAADKETAAKEAETAKAEALRWRMLVKYKLDEEDLDLLGSGTEEEIEKRAKRLSERGGGKAPTDDPKGRPKERLRSGATSTAAADETDPAKLAAEVPRSW